jgi:phosphatidylinositol 4-kinase
MRLQDYNARLRDLNTPLRFLAESELFRLSVWVNPTNDIKRSTDLIGTAERTLIDPSWINLIRCVWNIDPAIAIHLTERFKSPLIRNEVVRLVRSSPKDVLGVAEAVHFLLDNFNSNVRRDHKVKLRLSFQTCIYLSHVAPVSPSMGASASYRC